MGLAVTYYVLVGWQEGAPRPKSQAQRQSVWGVGEGWGGGGSSLRCGVVECSGGRGEVVLTRMVCDCGNPVTQGHSSTKVCSCRQEAYMENTQQCTQTTRTI